MYPGSTLPLTGIRQSDSSPVIPVLRFPLSPFIPPRPNDGGGGGGHRRPQWISPTDEDLEIDSYSKEKERERERERERVEYTLIE